MVFEKHIDSRGSFQELFRDKYSPTGFEVKQISQCTINPGETRGGHYHIDMSEGFIVISGRMILTQRESHHDTDAVDQVIEMSTYVNQIVYNRPGTWHEVTSEKGCVFLIVQNREHDPKNLDTYEIDL